MRRFITDITGQSFEQSGLDSSGASSHRPLSGHQQTFDRVSSPIRHPLSPGQVPNMSFGGVVPPRPSCGRSLALRYFGIWKVTQGACKTYVRSAHLYTRRVQTSRTYMRIRYLPPAYCPPLGPIQPSIVLPKGFYRFRVRALLAAQDDAKPRYHTSDWNPHGASCQAHVPF